MIDFLTEEKVLQGIILGAAAIILAPLILQIPHYAWATIQNMYVDICHLGLSGALKYRADIRPTKQTISQFVDLLWNFMRTIPLPALQRALDNETDKITNGFGKALGYERILMPAEGVPIKENKTLIEHLERIAHSNENMTASGTFYLNRDQYEISKEIRILSAQNGAHLANELHKTEYQAAIDMQIANASMLSELLHIDPEDARFIYTSGGTFSIFEAMSVYVHHARQKGVKRPIMLCGEYSHFAFDKAAAYTDARHILVPADPLTNKVCLRELQKAINWYGAGNIAVIAVAAPNYANGVIDDIEGTSKIAKSYNIPVHVDSCLGGYVTIFLEDDDELKTQQTDFACEGVTSISLDSHKYGLNGKGSSLIVFRKSRVVPTMQYINHNCGVYVTPGLAGSTRGELSVELYAMLTTLGKKKFTQNSQGIVRTTRDLARAVNAIPGIKVIGNAEELVCVVSIGLDHEYWVGKEAPYIHAIADSFVAKLGSTMNYIPDGFHICVTNNHVSNPIFLANFKKYLREAVQSVDPKVKPTTALGSAYVQLGKQAIFGCSVLPTEVGRRIAETTVPQTYDFILYDPSQAGNKPMQW